MADEGTLLKAIYTHLTNDAGVSGLVSTRVYPRQGPTSAITPYITHEKVSNVHERSFAGGSELAHPTIQINCWGSTLLEASGVATKVREALDNYSGTLGNGAGNTIDVGQGIFLDNDFELWEPPTEGSQNGTHRVVMYFTIWHAESATP